MRSTLDFWREAWRAKWLSVGPLVITTREKEIHRERNAYEIGRDVGAVDGPAPRPTSRGFLRVVS